MTTILVDHPRPGVRVLRLNRPDRLNTMTHELLTDLHAALDDADASDDVRVVVLTGEGRAFCAGLDLDGYADDFDATPGPVRGGLARQREIASAAENIRDLSKPVIAAVNGPAAGGGLALVLASDIRIASTDAVFSVAFIRAGFSACDIGTSWLLPRIVGAGRAHELMLTGRRFGAEEAERIGMLYRVVQPGDLMDVAMGKADEILRNPPFSVELTKQGMWLALEQPSFHAAVELENRQQILTSLTEDRAEATAAFLEKRDPQYQNR
ncbi:enoyl-CoA hydratase/isomerase family protein [Blastococcus sp. Marseille-P5729]|uniref:enoyl-CoA hydratase/isomerase family protein n=1 Tax=Blastococcus sp. Marseille-P5729 TaxID=2086582 RepID=UPI000D0F911A|nr:enoyl-CoA hydratase-related protein [Blastococcus sp. Marseille-P5729]